MQKIGVLIEAANGAVKQTSLGVVTAAREQGGELYALVPDGRAAEYQRDLEAYGVSRIVNITSMQGAMDWHPVLWARAILAAMQHFEVKTLLGLASAQGRELLPRMAAALEAPLAMDCVGLDLANHSAEKPLFSGKTIGTLRLCGTHFLFGLRPRVFDALPQPCTSQLIPFQADVQASRFSVKGIQRQRENTLDLSEAEIIISGGRPMQNRENFEILQACADVLGAAVGASRVAVDAGWVPHAMQVGQTGTTVNPKLYIACGISGSIQHFAGMKTSQVIVAINTDPEAPMVQGCDYAIIGDLFEIVPILTRQIKAIHKPDVEVGKP